MKTESCSTLWGGGRGGNAGRNISNLRLAHHTTFTAESKELKSFLVKVKEESGKVGLNLNIQKTKVMASGPITLWQIDGETMEIVPDFIFLYSKTTAMVTAAMKLKGSYSLEGKLWLTHAAKDGEALYSQQKQDQELTVAQIMNSLLPTSDLNWRK